MNRKTEDLRKLGESTPFNPSIKPSLLFYVLPGKEFLGLFTSHHLFYVKACERDTQECFYLGLCFSWEPEGMWKTLQFV
jgi:hypothetical protein